VPRSLAREESGERRSVARGAHARDARYAVVPLLGEGRAVREKERWCPAHWRGKRAVRGGAALSWEWVHTHVHHALLVRHHTVSDSYW
jgi:hypothetical protein